MSTCNPCTPPPSSCNCPPSPTPPWARPVLSPLIQTIIQPDTVNIDLLTTRLVKAVSVPSVPIAVVIPNGNYIGQYKQIFIPGDMLVTTEMFNLTGTFATYSSLTFNALGNFAELIWDGSAWNATGNVITNPYP